MDSPSHLAGKCNAISSRHHKFRSATLQLTANGGFFLANLFSILNPGSMTVQTPPELRAYGWSTVDLWCAPAMTGLYALMTHAQPFWADLHAVLDKILGGAASGQAIDPEVARVICAVVLSGLFASRAVVNFGLFKSMQKCESHYTQPDQSLMVFGVAEKEKTQ